MVKLQEEIDFSEPNHGIEKTNDRYPFEHGTGFRESEKLCDLVEL